MKLSGEVLAILSAISIGIAVPLGAQASKEIGALQMAAYSGIVSLALLWLLTLFTKDKIEAKKYLKKYPKEAFLSIATRAVIGSILYFYGVTLTTAMNSGFMMRLEPIFVIALGYLFLKERISKKQMFIVMVMLFGAFLYSTGGDLTSIGSNQIGDLLIVLSVLFFACSYIPLKKIGIEINSITITAVNNFIGSIIFLVIAILLSFDMFTVNLSNAWMMVGYVITLSVIGLCLYFASLRKTKAWIVSSLLSISSVVGAILSYLWLGETLGPAQWVGGAIILLASYFIAKK